MRIRKLKRMLSADKNIYLRHWRDLQRSGINHETASEAGIRSEDKRSLCFPYPGTTNFFRTKLFGERDGAKYLQPKDSGVRLYIPRKVNSKLRDINKELMITEGEKKTLKACQEGFDTVGLGGVWSWVQDHKPIDDLDSISWGNRQVTYVPDSDTWEKEDVIRAVFAFCSEVRDRGANVRVVKLPNLGNKKAGFDDYLMAKGRREFEKLEAKSLSDDSFNKARIWCDGSKYAKVVIDESIVDAENLLSLELPERKVLLHPWLKDGSVTLLSSWRGIGKTWFAMSICNALTTGGVFGPWRAPEAVPCLYLDAEMVLQDIVERIAKLKCTKRKASLYIHSADWANILGETEPNFASKKWREKMEQRLKHYGIKFWIVDNLSSAGSGLDEMSATEWEPVKRWLVHLRFEGISSMIIHHQGKDSKRGPRGTSSIEPMFTTLKV